MGYILPVATVDGGVEEVCDYDHNTTMQGPNKKIRQPPPATNDEQQSNVLNVQVESRSRDFR